MCALVNRPCAYLGPSGAHEGQNLIKSGLLGPSTIPPYAFLCTDSHIDIQTVYILHTDVGIVIQTVIQTVGIYYTDVQTVHI